VFWWLNKLLVAGARNVLGVDDIEAIEPKFDSRQLLNRLERAWENGMTPTHPMSMSLTLCANT